MNYKLLIVDDEPQMLQLLRIELGTAGYEVMTAKAGREAVDKAKNLKPHLILMDILLPDMNGADVVKTLRADPLTKFIPVIFLTALMKKEEENIEQTIKVDDFYYDSIAKPLNPELLLNKIKRTLGQPPVLKVHY